jgi:hypothetical protein
MLIYGELSSWCGGLIIPRPSNAGKRRDAWRLGIELSEFHDEDDSYPDATTTLQAPQMRHFSSGLVS